LAFVNRMDSIYLFVLPLVWLGLVAWRRRSDRGFPLWIWFGGPVAAWLLFATFYSRFPLPSPYYAKVATGIPGALLRRQGFAYLLNSFGHDPITLATMGIAALLSLRSMMTAKLAAAAALPYTLVTLSV